MSNYALAKQVGIEVEQRNTEEEWDVAFKRRVVSVAVSRKKKVAVDAIKLVVNGIFMYYKNVIQYVFLISKTNKSSEY